MKNTEKAITALTEMNQDTNNALLDVRQTARLINASSRTVYRLCDAGKMPRPVKLGALVRWRADELQTWIDAGCPAVSEVANDG